MNAAPQPRSLCLRKKKEEGRRETLPLASSSSSVGATVSAKNQESGGMPGSGRCRQELPCPAQGPSPPRGRAGGVVAGAWPPATWRLFLSLLPPNHLLFYHWEVPLLSQPSLPPHTATARGAGDHCLLRKDRWCQPPGTEGGTLGLDDLPGSQSQICHLQAERPWARD